MYNKLFTKILDSSIWLEPMPTRIVWLTFIAAMDEHGFAQFASAANVAHRARVTQEQADKAIAYLEGPDPDSSDPDHQGRRLERVPGGWLVLNADKYRGLVTKAVQQEQTRERVRRHRERKRNASVTVANDPVTPSEAVSEADTEARSRSKARSEDQDPRGFDAFWSSYPRKVGKGSALKAWSKLLPSVSVVLAALEWQVHQPAWTRDEGQYIPHPATWLNRRGWEDEPFTPVAPEPSRRGRGASNAAAWDEASAALEAKHGERERASGIRAEVVVHRPTSHD